MKTEYYVREVWVNKLSVKVEPLPGTGTATVWSRCTERPETNTKWTRAVNSCMLADTHLPKKHQTPAAVALCWLFDAQDVVDVIIYDAANGDWQVDINVIIRDEVFSGRGRGPTPADAIRAAAIDASAKAAR